MYLDHLKLPDEAVRVVNESQSIEAAQLVAKLIINFISLIVITIVDTCRFFQKINDYASALQFLVLSKCNDEAFNMAEV